MTVKPQKPANTTIRKAVIAFLTFLLMAGLYGAAISLCNRFLREYGLMSTASRLILGAFMVTGFYLLYRWLVRRLDGIAKSK